MNHEEGKAFETTLSMALKSQSQIIQIATWNDYGEGTVIESTVEDGYNYLKQLMKSLNKN